MKIVDLMTSIKAGEAEVSLDVILGDAQLGSSAVKLGDQLIAKGERISCNLGHGSTLVGRVLTTKSNVTDVNNSTNKTSVEYIFHGSNGTQTFLSKSEVDQNGDAIVYRSAFTFI